MNKSQKVDFDNLTDQLKGLYRQVECLADAADIQNPPAFGKSRIHVFLLEDNRTAEFFVCMSRSKEIDFHGPLTKQQGQAIVSKFYSDPRLKKDMKWIRVPAN